MRNFGWPCYEGGLDANGAPVSRKFDALRRAQPEHLREPVRRSGTATAAPYWAYDHATDGRARRELRRETRRHAISGIAFYPTSGGTFPAAYDGALFFADHSRECIWVMPPAPTACPTRDTVQIFVQARSYPVDLEVGPGGDLFYVDIDDGEIRRIRYTGNPTNQPPTAVANAQADADHRRACR